MGLWITHGSYSSQIHLLFQVSLPKAARFRESLITRKVLDVRRQGATTEAYGAIRRKPVVSLKVEREERSKATPSFDASTLLSIDPELRRRVDFAQGHEPVEWQMMP